ncbi:hypothetical protein SNE26_23320 [Mucilaginibacter sp. cycad4]|uniref:hypothetical protein n=1 Tax=Mucilaginibacter sp. cycad4 TaxID=3342096 RepID=UPI002AAA8DF3|nr:hypothetical protein [Mucilaginibacter gossypii]WPU98946.1 hypothetical protein SNE26_23320 [Mucilaginibacter gossypii]
MKKFIILTFIAASIAFTSCHSSDKNTTRQNDTSAAKGNPADSTKTMTLRDSVSTSNSSDSTTLGADTDSAVHPVH